MDVKIFRNANKRRDKACDTARALDAAHWEPDSLSTKAKASSSIVAFEIHFLPLPRITPKSPVSSNFLIIFFKACHDREPFRKLFKRRYSRNAVEKLPQF